MKRFSFNLAHALLGIVAGGALLSIVGCEKKTAAPPPQRPPPAVTVFKAVAKDVPVYLDEIGKCVAPEVVSVQPQVAGRITEAFVKDGVELKKGDRLFTIDPRPFQAQVEQAQADVLLNKASLVQTEANIKRNEAQLEEAQANLEQTKYRQNLNETEFNRAKNLLENNAIPKQEYDTRQMTMTVGEAQVRAATATVAVADAQLRQTQAEIAMAKAKVAASEAAVKSAELNLEYTNIVSPIDGRAGQRLVDLGNVVQTMNAPTLVVIQRLDPLYADFTIPETELANVRKSMAAGQLKVDCRIPNTEATRTGDVSFLDNAVADGSGTIKMRAVIPNADRLFWPGQFISVKLILSTKKDAVLVPVVATQIAQTGPYVYVVKSEKDGPTAELHPVKLGQRHGEQIVIDDGVAPNDDVIVTGQLMVYPKAIVSVQDPNAAPAGAPGAPPPDKDKPKADAAPKSDENKETAEGGTKK